MMYKIYYFLRPKLPSRTLCTFSIEVGANALQKKVAQKNMTSFSKIEILIYYLLTYNSFSKKKNSSILFFRCGFILLNLIFIAIIMKLPTRKRSRKEILANMDEETTIWRIFVPSSKSNNSKEDANNNAGENNPKVENV